MKTPPLFIFTATLLIFHLGFLKLSSGNFGMMAEYHSSYLINEIPKLQPKLEDQSVAYPNLSSNQKPKDYWLFTSRMSRCIIRDDSGERELTNERMDQAFYDVTCISRPSYLSLEQDGCDENPTIIICTPRKRKCTRKIHLEYGEEIALDSCFIKYKSKIGDDIKDVFLWTKSVIDEIMSVRIICTKDAGLKGDGDTPKQGENVALEFTQTNYAYFMDWMDFDIKFRTLKGDSIESLYIIESNSHDDLVLCAGDVSDMEEIYDFSNKLIPRIDMVLEKVSEIDTSVEYRFIESTLKVIAYKKLKKNKSYQMNVKLRNDENYYAINFQFLSNEDIEFLKSFDKDE